MSIFTEIIAGKIPSHKIIEDDTYYAFLDIRPIAKGHTLVVPKQEVDYIFDLEEDLLSGLLTFSRPIAKAIEQVVPCQRVGVMVAGLEVPHTHVHLVPINAVTDLNFANAQDANQDELTSLAGQIKSALA